MAIYLIRHGETDGNTTGVVQFPHTPLNTRGFAQAELVAQHLKAGANIQYIISSDYARARSTAEAIQTATGAELILNPLLRERHFGDLRGKSRTEIRKTHGELYHPDLQPPNGESWPQFHARIDQAWAAVAEFAVTLEPEQDLAVVSHGLVCYSLALRHLQVPEGYQAAPNFGNTAITIIEPHPPWRVLDINNINHLDSASGDQTSSDSGV